MGDVALFANSDVSGNTAIGDAALQNNGATTGLFTANGNTAVGFAALFANDSGGDNAAVGTGALSSNDSGLQNEAMGSSSPWRSNVAGGANVAIGDSALSSSDGIFSTAVGWSALIADTAWPTRLLALPQVAPYPAAKRTISMSATRVSVATRT